MKSKITASEKAFGRAVENATPAYPAPDRIEMLVKSYAIAMEQMEQKKNARAGRIRRFAFRGLIAVSAALIIVLVSSIMASLFPTTSASADSWFDKIVKSLQSAFRIETTPAEIEDNPVVELMDFASIEAARSAGYIGYAPTYLPVGYTLEYVKYSQSDSRVDALFSYTNDDLSVMIVYQNASNLRFDTSIDDEDDSHKFEWNGFYGAITEYEGGYVALSCANTLTNELLSLNGPISAKEADEIVRSMKRGEVEAP